VRNIFICNEGYIWVGTIAHGFNRFDPVTETFIRIPGTPENPITRVYTICGDNSGCLWIGTNGLFKYEPQKNKYTYYGHNPDIPNSLGSFAVHTLLYDEKSEILWIGTFDGGLDKFDPKTEKFTHYRHDPKNPNSISNNNVRAIFIDQSATLWLGTYTGLSRFDIRKEEFTGYRHDPSDPHSLSNNFIVSIHEDRAGAVWFGARGGGLNIYDRKLGKFLSYQHDPKIPNSLRDNNVWAFEEDENGAIWIATENGGLHKFDPDLETFTNYEHNPDDPESLSSNNLYSMCMSRTGRLWVGSTYGLNEFDPKTGKVIRYSGGFGTNLEFTTDKLLSNFIITTLEDRAGILWVGTQYGLDRYDPIKKQFTHHFPEPGSHFSQKNDIRAIYEDIIGSLWIGTKDGELFEFDRETEKFILYNNEIFNAQNLTYTISSITEDHEGMLWIGTKGGGIHKIDRAKEKITVYSRKDGLPNNIINGILEDDQHNMWVSTSKGLSRYNRSTNTFRNYSQKSGLQSYEFHTGSYYKSKNGEMYFGGTKGFNRFFPGKVIDNMYIPPVVITGFKIPDKSRSSNGDLLLQKEIHFEDEVELSYRENIFSIEFAALDYTAPEKNQYKCMLTGFNEDWISLGTKNDITFTNLDPGIYTFRVMGSNNDGYWSAKGASLKIRITPPFWQTWYFRGLIVILFFGLLFGLHKLRTTRIKQELEKKRLEKEIRLKGDFTAMLVHDLRSPLTAIIGYSDMLNEMPDQMDVKKTGQVIHRSSEKMLALINDMLELSKFEAGKMSLEKKEVDIVGTVMEIVEIISPLFKKRNIELTWDFKPAARETKLSIDEEKIGQVITNFLSNAAKFTPRKGDVMIEAFKTSGDFIQVSVTDNGPGVPPGKHEFLFDKYVQFSKGLKTKGTGLGLAVSKLIIEAHGGKIGFEPAENSTGSTFYFRLPIVQSINTE
jgi:signal transduction histidine kinase/ligand-binding sensor domain-containing protein